MFLLYSFEYYLYFKIFLGTERSPDSLLYIHIPSVFKFYLDQSFSLYFIYLNRVTYSISATEFPMKKLGLLLKQVRRLLKFATLDSIQRMFKNEKTDQCEKGLSLVLWDEGRLKEPCKASSHFKVLI